jgi:RNA polymerase Rpb2, domain 7
MTLHLSSRQMKSSPPVFKGGGAREGSEGNEKKELHKKGFFNKHSLLSFMRRKNAKHVLIAHKLFKAKPSSLQHKPKINVQKKLYYLALFYFKLCKSFIAKGPVSYKNKKSQLFNNTDLKRARSYSLKTDTNLLAFLHDASLYNKKSFDTSLPPKISQLKKQKKKLFVKNFLIQFFSIKRTSLFLNYAIALKTKYVTQTRKDKLRLSKIKLRKSLTNYMREHLLNRLQNNFNTASLYSKNKWDLKNSFFPKWVWKLNQKQSREFLSILLLFNKTKILKNIPCSLLADQIFQLCLHAGWKAKKSLNLKSFFSWQIKISYKDWSPTNLKKSLDFLRIQTVTKSLTFKTFFKVNNVTNKINIFINREKQHSHLLGETVGHTTTIRHPISAMQNGVFPLRCIAGGAPSGGLKGKAKTGEKTFNKLNSILFNPKALSDSSLLNKKLFKSSPFPFFNKFKSFPRFLQVLFCSTSINSDRRKSCKFMFNLLSESGRLNNKEKDLKLKNNTKFLNYKGPVYCLKIPGETFLVRRNGKYVWTGNSRSTGPYSLVTQQPLRGRSKQGGQRVGEMEVWAFEGYGAAFALLELLTLKSDDRIGRMTVWESILRQKTLLIGTPASFRVLLSELQSLCLDIGIYSWERGGQHF